MADGISGYKPKASFDELWCDVIRSLPVRWQDFFIPQRILLEERPQSRWALCPNTVSILNQASTWSSGEQLFMGCLVSFYNGDDGQKILADVGYPNFVHALNNLDRALQAKIFDLIRAYDGW